MAYVYRHIRLDKNEPFYIGIGINDDDNFERSGHKYNRNKSWKEVVSMTDYEVEILMENITWEEACKKEIEFITLYGRADLGKGSLVNLTDGGNGPRGGIAWNKGIPRTDEVKEKLRKANLGKKHTEESKKKISLTSKGRSHPHSEETKKKMSKAKEGYIPWNVGIKHSEETKQKISRILSGRKGKSGIDNPMSIILLDINTGVFYETLGQFSKLHNIKYETVINNIRGKKKRKNKFPNIKIV